MSELPKSGACAVPRADRKHPVMAADLSAQPPLPLGTPPPLPPGPPPPLPSQKRAADVRGKSPPLPPQVSAFANSDLLFASYAGGQAGAGQHVGPRPPVPPTSSAVFSAPHGQPTSVANGCPVSLASGVVPSGSHQSLSAPFPPEYGNSYLVGGPGSFPVHGSFVDSTGSNWPCTFSQAPVLPSAPVGSHFSPRAATSSTSQPNKGKSRRPSATVVSSSSSTEDSPHSLGRVKASTSVLANQFPQPPVAASAQAGAFDVAAAQAQATLGGNVVSGQPVWTQNPPWMDWTGLAQYPLPSHQVFQVAPQGWVPQPPLMPASQGSVAAPAAQTALPASSLASGGAPSLLEDEPHIDGSSDEEEGFGGVDVGASFFDALDILAEVCPDAVRSSLVASTAMSELDANLGGPQHQEGKSVLCESRLIAHSLHKFSQHIAGADKQSQPLVVSSSPGGGGNDLPPGGDPRPGALPLNTQVAPPKQPYPSGSLFFASLPPSSVPVDASDRQLLQGDKPSPPSSAPISDANVQRLETGARNALASASVLDWFLKGLMSHIQAPDTAGESFALRDTMDVNAVFQMARRCNEALKDLFAQISGVYGNSVLLRRDIFLSSRSLGISAVQAQRSVRAAPLPAPGDGLFSRSIQESLEAETQRLVRQKALRDAQREQKEASQFPGPRPAPSSKPRPQKPQFQTQRKRQYQSVQSSSSRPTHRPRKHARKDKGDQPSTPSRRRDGGSHSHSKPRAGN